MFTLFALNHVIQIIQGSTHAFKSEGKVLTQKQVGNINIRVVEGDITKAGTEAIVNAANKYSFTSGDSGISGALLGKYLGEEKSEILKMKKNNIGQ